MDVYLPQKDEPVKSTEETATEQPVVRGLANDLANLFIKGTLSDRDIRRLPKNIRQEVSEKIQILQGAVKENPSAPTDEVAPAPSVKTENETALSHPQQEGALLPPAITGVIEKTTPLTSPLYSFPETTPQKKESDSGTPLTFTENDIAQARKEMERQRQTIVSPEKEPEPVTEKTNTTPEPPQTVQIKTAPIEVPETTVEIKPTETYNQPEITPTTPIETEADLDKKITELLTTIESLPNTKNIFGKEREVLEQKKKALQDREKPLLEKEQSLEAEARKLDEETANNPNETLLKKRWDVESKRRTTEEERWKLDEERVVLLEEEQALIQKETTASSKERELREALELVRKKKMRFTLEREKIDLEKKIAENKKGREPLELDWIRLNEKKKKALEFLTQATQKTQTLTTEKKHLEEKEASAQDSTIRHTTENARWEIEKQKKDLEISYLEQKKNIEATEREITTLTETYRKLLQNELAMGKELARIREDLIHLP